ncbi:MAG TPA: DUF411 domain-containing protein [Longimicrobiales bacterium]
MKKLLLLPVGVAAIGAAVAIRAAATRPAPAAEAAAPLADGAAPTITVYKSPTCGCCRKWVEHVRKHGFEVVTHDTQDMTQVKAASGVPGELASCHTAIVDGYVIEGHVPADLIRRMLDERPQILGLAVPGMPMGAPGMEGPYKEDYDVLAIRRDGTTEVYASR